jgi:multiple sugar transport system permease protein
LKKTLQITGFLLLGLALYWLYPHSQISRLGEESSPLSPSEPITEIIFLGPAMASDRAACQVAIDAFERKFPHYRVRLAINTTVDLQGDPTRFLISLAGGAPPDLIHFDRFAVSEWAARGAFTPLDPYLAKDASSGNPDAIRKEDFFEPAWNEAQWSGVTYGIPNDLDTRLLYYNKDMLVRAGLVDEKGEAKPPRTWEELESYSLKLTERDDKGNIKVLGFAPNYGNAFLYIYGWMNGGEFLSEDGRTCTLTDPRIVSALDWMVRLYDSIGGYPVVDAFQKGFQADALDPFITGKVAMKIDGYWEMARMAAYGTNLNYALAPPPMPQAELDAGRKPLTWMGGWVYAIPSTAKQKDGAWELTRWLSSPEANRLMADQMRRMEAAKGRIYVPRQHPNKKINALLAEEYVEKTTLKPEFKAGARLFNEMIPQARFRPITPVGQVMWRAQVDGMEAALYKQGTPLECLEKARQGVQRSLDEFYAPPKGRPMEWKWFFLTYAVLIIAGALLLPRLDRRFREDAAEARPPRRGEKAGGYAFASPWIIGFLAITAGAMLFSFFLSFCSYDLINPARFVGLENYSFLLSGDELFWQSLANTGFMLLGVPLGMALSLAMAVLLTVEVKGVPIWRTLFYLPSIVPLVASSILWVWIFNPQAGLLNSALDVFGISGLNWLGSKETSKLSLLILGLWTSGGGMIIWIAGLKGIPESYYEAAAIDGATAWHRFRHITLPMLTPYILFNLIMGLIGTFKIFEVAYIMTNGGPVNSTTFYVYHLFNQAFRFLNMGAASAMAWILFAIVALLTVLQLRLSRKWVNYDQG